MNFGDAAPIPDKNVDYVILSEFDIDKGSVCRFQYPEPTGVSEGLLAELMLPEGAHNREEDWTIFFLNRTHEDSHPKSYGGDKPGTEHPLSKKLEIVSYRYDLTIQDWEFIGDEDDREFLAIDTAVHSAVGPDDNPWELVITDAKGRIMEHIAFHENMQYTVLQPQFASLYKIDGTAVGVQFSSNEDQKLLTEAVEKCLRPDTSATETPQTPKEPPKPERVFEGFTNNPSKPFLYCLNLVRTKKDKSVRRGAIVKSMAICTQHQTFHVFKPILVLALEKYFDAGGDEGMTVLSYLYNTINAMDISTMPRLTELQKQVSRLQRITVSNSDTRDASEYFSSSMIWEAVKIPVRIPLTLQEDEYGEASVSTLVKKFKENTPIIYNALLSEKRVIILGHNHPAREVCNYVLSAILLVAPLSGFLHRAFPYATLSNIEFLEIKGYIAGVTNPVFEQQQSWWDVLCDLDNGRVVQKSSVTGAKLKDNEKEEVPRHMSADMELMNEVMNGIQAHYGEFWVRSLFRDSTQQVIDMTFNEEEFVDEASRHQLYEINRDRIAAWQKTLSYDKYKLYRKHKLETRSIRAIDVSKYIRKLKVRRNLPDNEMYEIYADFVTHVKTEAELMEFLSYLPESQGGLYPVAVSLFHPLEVVRLCTVTLLRRLDALKVGVKLISSLNYFLLLAYHRHAYLVSEEEIMTITPADLVNRARGTSGSGQYR
eukprot:GFYU01005716.1.p1 GENE.GFYU01005716.1~~GFYU01005716.1.p1  ORF type:complete len:710 (-),score=142.81 GFYU01005716.1:76-2205(-)